MSDRKKIDWSKPIRLKNNAGVAYLTPGLTNGYFHYGYVVTGGGAIIPISWAPNGMAAEECDGTYDIENVPEKFGRWVVVIRKGSTTEVISCPSREYAAEKADYERRYAHGTFAAYVTGSDGDVIGGEGDKTDRLPYMLANGTMSCGCAPPRETCSMCE